MADQKSMHGVDQGSFTFQSILVRSKTALKIRLINFFKKEFLTLSLGQGGHSDSTLHGLEKGLISPKKASNHQPFKV